MIKSIMDLDDKTVVFQAMAKVRGFTLNIGNNLEDMRLIKQARLNLAEYYYNDMKKRLSKKKKVTEDEFNMRKNDLELAQKNMFI